MEATEVRAGVGGEVDGGGKGGKSDGEYGPLFLEGQL